MNFSAIKNSLWLLEYCGVVGTKTYAYFLRTLDKAVRELWKGSITESQFVDGLADLLSQQMRRAWNEGMRENGLDPKKDMTPEWEEELQDLIADQFSYVDGYASEIVSASKKDGVTVDAFRARVEMWANNYTSTVNTAQIVTASAKDRFKWVVGPTEHCGTCAALDGVVATAEKWNELRRRGIEPQGDKLECGGWKCQCRYEPTNEPLSDLSVFDGV
jgi:hypothetical protein